ncbi:MAG: flagellar protein FlgN [Desulfobacterales bacterium]|nr:flagellar protein FlgN [Desulfobacterales bacterium]
MEETMVEYLEKSLYEKIFLYNDLLHCFKREKEALINMDLDNLWNISKEKDELCSKIDSIRQKIFSAVHFEPDQQHLAPALIMARVPVKDRAKFHELYYTLQKLKNEIDAIRELNVRAVDHSLKFLDEIISIISGQARQDVIYNDRCRLNQSKSNMILSREV